jgi:uncharacterized membrane protein YqiK
MTAVLALAGVLVVFGIVLMLVVKSLLFICPPNEVLIFSGGQRAAPVAPAGLPHHQGRAGRSASRCSRRSIAWI